MLKRWLFIIESYNFSLYLFILARICSKHFDEHSFEIPLKHQLLHYNPKNFRNLKPEAVPELNLPGHDKKSKGSARSSRLSKRTRQQYVSELLKQAQAEPQEPQPSTSQQTFEEPMLVEIISARSSSLEILSNSGDNNNE